MQAATVRQLIGVTGLLAVAAVAAITVSPSTLVERLESLADEPLLFVLVLTALYLVRPFLLWPVSALGVVLGFVYAPALAFPAALIGGTLTAAPPYFVGRYAQTDMGLFGTVGTSGAQLVDVVGEVRTIIAARLSPVPGDPISYGAGLAGVSPRPFFAGSAIGEIPWAFVAVATGASMRSLSVSGATPSPALLVVLAGFAVLTLAGPVYSHVRRSQAT